MDGEQIGSRKATQDGMQEQVQQAQQQESPGSQEVIGNNSGTDWKKQIADRDARITELEGQVAEAAKNAETAESLRGEMAELKAHGESDWIDFRLQLAGVRNVKAARAILADHANDFDKLKEAVPWLFEGDGKHAAKGGEGGAGGGKMDLPNAGAVTDSDKRLTYWRDIAGLTDDDKKKE